MQISIVIAQFAPFQTCIFSLCTSVLLSLILVNIIALPVLLFVIGDPTDNLGKLQDRVKELEGELQKKG